VDPEAKALVEGRGIAGDVELERFLVVQRDVRACGRAGVRA